MPKERMDREAAAKLRMLGLTWGEIQLIVRRKSGQVFDVNGLARATNKYIKEHQPLSTKVTDDDRPGSD